MTKHADKNPSADGPSEWHRRCRMQNDLQRSAQAPSLLCGAWLLTCLAAPTLGAGHGARYLPDRLRQLPENAPALTCGCSLPLRRRHRLGHQSLLLSVGTVSRGAACRRDRCRRRTNVVQPRRRRFFRRFAQRVEARSSGPGMGFRVVVTRDRQRRRSLRLQVLPARGRRPQTTGMTLDISRSTTVSSTRTRRR